MRAYTPPDWVMLVVVLAGLLFVIAALGVAFSDVSQSCFEVGARYLSVFDVLNVAVTLLLTPLNYFVMKLSRRGAFLAFLCLTFLGVAGLFAFNLSTYADTASYFLGVRVSLLSSVLAVASSR